MARYTGPVCRLCRRERTKLFLKGERCYSMKCPVSEAVTDRHSRAYPPGEHGRDRMRHGNRQHDSKHHCAKAAPHQALRISRNGQREALG